MNNSIKRIIISCIIIIIVAAIFLLGYHKLQEIQLLGNYKDTDNISFASYIPQEETLLAEDLCVVSQEEDSSDDKTITAQAGAVFDISDKQVLFNKNIFEKLSPASITVLTTALVVLNNKALTDKVTVSESAVSGLQNTSNVGLHAGDTLTVEQLLYGMLLSSGIDAANVLAESVGGTQEEFVKMMNQTVTDLGCTDTHYMNPGGLTDENHYTTVYDIYLIMNTLLKNTVFMDIIKTSSYNAVYTDAQGEEITKEYTSTVQYLTDNTTQTDNGVAIIGGKTGTTISALHCLAVFARDKNKKDYVTLILKAKSKDILYKEMDKIIHKIP